MGESTSRASSVSTAVYGWSSTGHYLRRRTVGLSELAYRWDRMNVCRRVQHRLVGLLRQSVLLRGYQPCRPDDACDRWTRWLKDNTMVVDGKEGLGRVERCVGSDAHGAPAGGLGHGQFGDMENRSVVQRSLWEHVLSPLFVFNQFGPPSMRAKREEECRCWNRSIAVREKAVLSRRRRIRQAGHL